MRVQINNKQNVFFCTDPHFGHAGIVKGTSKWTDTSRCRPFDTLEDHDEMLVNNINQTVGEDDVLFCLGDWSFGSYKNGDNVNNVIKFRERLNCKNIHLITGNHDQEIIKTPRLQELFSSVNQVLEIVVTEQPTIQNQKPIKQLIFLSHYAHRVWDKSHAGSWMLYGHSHGTLDEFTPLTANPSWIGDQYYIKNYRTMDVGFDCHPEFRPYSYQEIKDIMVSRAVELEIDHHVGNEKATLSCPDTISNAKKSLEDIKSLVIGVMFMKYMDSYQLITKVNDGNTLDTIEITKFGGIRESFGVPERFGTYALFPDGKNMVDMLSKPLLWSTFIDDLIDGNHEG